MSLEKNSHVIIFGGIPDEHRGRALGPYRIRTVVENMGLTASLIDYFWNKPLGQIIRHINYCVGPQTVMFGISYTWIRDIMSQSVGADSSDHENREKNCYGSVDELLNLILLWFKNNHPHVKIVVGSATAASIDSNILDKIHWIVDGFAELSTPALLNHLIKGQDLKYSVRGGVKYVDSNIDYRITDINKLEVKYKPSDNFFSHQPLTLETCRGCLWNCAYCQYAFRGKKDYEYIRSVDHIADELRRNYEMFGTTRYIIADDTFNDSEEKITRVLNAVDRAGLPDFKFTCYLRPEMLVTRPAMVPLLIELGISGAHLGLESFNNQSRKLIGRSGDINRIKEQLCLLKQNSKNYVGLFGSFIVGLPYDSIDDIISWNQTLCKEQGEFLDQWWWHPLQINKNNVGEKISLTQGTIVSQSNQSLIEKNPEKYGYTVDLDRELDGSSKTWWKNKFMNLDDAKMLTGELFDVYKNYTGLGGWSVAFGWYFNLTDQEIRTTKFHNYDFKARGRKTCEERFQYWENHIEFTNFVSQLMGEG